LGGKKYSRGVWWEKRKRPRLIPKKPCPPSNKRERGPARTPERKPQEIRKKLTMERVTLGNHGTQK